MPDYKEMYLTLFRATEQAINLLIAAQQTCEDMYVNASEDNLSALPSTPDAEEKLYRKRLQKHLLLEPFADPCK